jgi:hypothetical protein
MIRRLRSRSTGLPDAGAIVGCSFSPPISTSRLSYGCLPGLAELDELLAELEARAREFRASWLLMR